MPCVTFLTIQCRNKRMEYLAIVNSIAAFFSIKGECDWRSIGGRLEVDFDLLASFQYYNETKYIRRQKQISYVKIVVFDEVYI